jgi:hypothetical protein
MTFIGSADEQIELVLCIVPTAEDVRLFALHVSWRPFRPILNIDLFLFIRLLCAEL